MARVVGAGKVLNKKRYSKKQTTQVSGGDLDDQAAYTNENLGIKSDHAPAKFATIRDMEKVHGSTSTDAEENQPYNDQLDHKIQRPPLGDKGGNMDHMLRKKRDLDTNTYVTDISSPNQLHQFASYNTIFTLSVLHTNELQNTKTLLTSPPHDIILRSGGIGAASTAQTSAPGKGGMSSDNRKTLEGRKAQTYQKAEAELRKNNDMYFKNVTMNNIPGLNEQRRLTSVTQVNMEIVEPWGISLIDRLRAGAANNNYLDHLDAPYMLTVQFIGWDEKGMPIPQDVVNTTKRVIPLKLTNMSMDVNQSGTIYQLQGIPWSEFAYVDRYNYPRTSGTLEPKGKTLASVADALTDILNKQNEDEQKDNLVALPDKYEITIDTSFKPSQTMISNKAIAGSTMYVNNVIEKEGLGSSLHGKGSRQKESKIGGKFITLEDGTQVIRKEREKRPGPSASYHEDVKLEYMKIDSNSTITSILENIMKSHPDMTADKKKEWQEKVTKSLINVAETPGSSQQHIDQVASGEEMYFNFFKIRSTVVPTGKFDTRRQKNQKLIKFVVSPYKIHAYSLAIPGVSTGKNMKQFVYKTYNHMFTGENVDILNIDIKYKVAYFTSVLKDVAGDTEGANKFEAERTKTTDAGVKNPEPNIDPPFTLTSEPGLAKSGGTGSTDTKYTHFDQFMDALTHPLADMVNIKLEILGDPAWLGQAQFIPAVPLFIKPGESDDLDVKYWRGHKDAIWNDEYKCYNADIAEPIILFNFRMPTDMDDKTGTYEIAKEQQATFSGLYKVVQVEHNWDGGNYTNLLHLTRFNNQGVYISKPEQMVVKEDAFGGSRVMTAAEARNADRKGSNETPFSFLGSNMENIKRPVENITNNVTKKSKSQYMRSPHSKGAYSDWNPGVGGGGGGNVASAMKTGPQDFFDRSKQFNPAQGNSYNPYVRQSTTPSDDF